MKRTVVLALVILIIACGVWYSYYNLTFTHLFLNDAMDYASMGRNVARGDGFVSSYITPLGLANREGLPHPDLWRAPLWPAVLGLFVKLLGATDQAVAIATACFYVAGAVMVFLLGQQLFGRLVGVVSALVFIFSGQNLLNSISGMTETIAVFLMVLVIYLLVAPWTRNAWGDILAGAVTGLFYLTRYNALLFVPFFALFLWFRRRRGSPNRAISGQFKGRLNLWPVARYVAAFALVISPWLVRNYLLMGSPMFSLQKFEPVMFTPAYPGYSMYMMFEKVNVMNFLLTHPGDIWAKVTSGWAEFTQGLFNPTATGVSPYLFGMFLVSLIIPFNYLFSNYHHSNLRARHHGWTVPDKIEVNGVKLLIAACFLVQLAALLVIHFIYRLFFIFMPFYIIFGIAGLVWLLKFASDWLPVKRGGFVLLFTVVVTGLLISSNLPSWAPLQKGDLPILGFKDSVRAVTNMSTKKELIISNDGHLLAWYGDRYAAKLPYSVDMIPQMEKLAPVKFIYLSARVSWNIPEADKSWHNLFWSKPKEVYGFKLAGVYPDGSVVYRK